MLAMFSAIRESLEKNAADPRSLAADCGGVDFVEPSRFLPVLRQFAQVQNNK
jgi:hypothetical protein